MTIYNPREIFSNEISEIEKQYADLLKNSSFQKILESAMYGHGTIINQNDYELIKDKKIKKFFKTVNNLNILVHYYFQSFFQNASNKQIEEIYHETIKEYQNLYQEYENLIFQKQKVEKINCNNSNITRLEFINSLSKSQIDGYLTLNAPKTLAFNYDIVYTTYKSYIEFLKKHTESPIPTISVLNDQLDIKCILDILKSNSYENFRYQLIQSVFSNSNSSILQSLIKEDDNKKEDINPLNKII